MSSSGFGTWLESSTAGVPWLGNSSGFGRWLESSSVFLFVYFFFVIMYFVFVLCMDCMVEGGKEEKRGKSLGRLPAQFKRPPCSSLVYGLSGIKDARAVA